jgi:cytochrome o ubiquinol oxidase subunit 1
MELIFGRLTLASLPHEWFTIGGTIAMTLMLLGVVVFITKSKRWKWLWNDWFTSTDPKKIGIMYMIMAALMLVRGAMDAGMIWLQQIMSVGSSQGYLTADHFQQIFTAHGVIMVFFVTMGFLFGLLNYIIPLQIGARDLASPFLNTLGFWLYVGGCIMVNLFFVFGGEFAATGWLAIAPLSELQFSPGVGMDFWIWSLQVSGLGTLIGAINFIMTIVKKRAPGMTFSRLPLFVWTSLFSMALVVSIFPILTATITLLSLDRVMGMHFFTTDAGGSAMMYTNLIWMWGHPEVYVLILPSFGIYSEVVSTFSKKRLSGYTSMVLAGFGVASIAIVVWLHHFFTMGSGANVNAFFGIMTSLIAIPAGVQILNWISTMYKGKIRVASPFLWFFGFLATFTVGGMAGVILAMPPADFQLHNSLFLVAHFHTMIIGGALFGIFAGITFWFPKVTGFTLNEKLGRYAFWCWLIGFLMLFIILQKIGIVNFVNTSSVSYGTAFLIGVVASLSSCMAVVGGLVLSMSATFSKEGDKVKPQLLFHFGRIISFFILGGVIGAIGSAFTLNITGTFVLSLLVGLVMLVLGINLLDVFHFAKKFQIGMPRFLSKHALGVSKLNHSLTPLLVGVATFFLPCGFTQSMQVYALSSGSFLNGGLTMLFFALGTFPVLAILSFGSFSINKSSKSGIFFKTAGLIVIAFAVLNILNALVVMGLIKPFLNF